MKSHLKAILLGLLSFVLAMVIFNITYTYYIRDSVEDEKNRYQYIAMNEANYISSCIDKVIVRTYTIREMLVENDGDTAFFDKIASHVYQSVKNDTGVNLRNILIAPDGVVSKIYPQKSNENLMGFNYLDESLSGNKEAIEAFEKGETIITNPFNLMQGGVGMAARTPVYINRGNKTELWGLVAVTMDFDDMVKAFDLIQFDKMHLKYKLWYKDGNGEKVTITGSQEELKNSISEFFIINNCIWHLDLLPEAGWYSHNKILLGRLIIFIVSFLVTLIVYFIIRIRDDGFLMKQLAEQDSLTHVYSRNYLNSTILDVHTGEWKKANQSFSLAMVDMDNFKKINDTYGHNIGDRALIAVADILKKNITDKKDRIIRFGGDEFIMIINDPVKKSVRIRMQTILSQVESIVFDDYPDLRLTVSIGAVSYENAVEKGYKSMIKKADENLYLAKERGRDDYEIL